MSTAYEGRWSKLRNGELLDAAERRSPADRKKRDYNTPREPEDVSQVRNVNELAFGQPAEADLVERLRQACDDSLSLVAEDDAVVGHILFTPVVVESAGRRVFGMGLAPMAVLPDRQRQGIGSQLVRRGLDILRERGCPFVVAVGYSEYYPRFGFEPASTHRLTAVISTIQPFNG